MQENAQDPSPLVSETCQIAIAKINYSPKESTPSSKFDSIDPAPALSSSIPIPTLREILLDTSIPLFERYRAMFALRNIGSSEAVLALCDGLKDKSSALFRHEIAYVLGQLSDPISVAALSESLNTLDEAGIVRHESAEALGSIATPEVFPILKPYTKDSKSDIVRDSCLVALDMAEYENSNELHYANGLVKFASED